VDLVSLARERTVETDLRGFPCALMGSASAGPLWVGPRALDLSDFEPLAENGPLPGVLAKFNDYRIAPDGRAYTRTGQNERSFRAESVVASLDPTRARPNIGNALAGAGYLVPGADGLIYTGRGFYAPDGTQLGAPSSGQTESFLKVPAEEGDYYLAGTGGGGRTFSASQAPKLAVVHRGGDRRALLTLPDVDLPLSDPTPFPNTTFDRFTCDKRVLFTVRGKTIAVLPYKGNKLVVYPCDIEGELARRGADHLLFTSRPPAPVPGEAFRYPIRVSAKRLPVAFALDAGPPGATVSPEGVVTWQVPAPFDRPVTLRVLATDSSGQLAAHEFSLLTGAGASPPIAVLGAPAPAAQTDPYARPGARGVLIPAEVPVALPVATVPDGAVLKLPGAADWTGFGGGGRFAVFRVPDAREVIAVDLCKGHAVVRAPLAEPDAVVAAGNTHLFVCARRAHTIQRWNLITGKLEATVANPLRGVPHQLLLGHATNGPLFVAGPDVALDPITFEPVPFASAKQTPADLGSWTTVWKDDRVLSVSPDGQLLAWWSPRYSPTGVTARRAGAGPADSKATRLHETHGPVRAGPDGIVFTADGPYTPELKPLEALDLSYGNDIGAAGIEALGGLPKLRKLRLEESAAAVAANAKAFGKLTHLTHLTIWIADTTTGGELELPALPELVELNLYQHRVSDKTLAPLLGPKLQVLSVAGANVTDATLAALEKCPDLRKVTLSYTSATERGLDVFARLKKLEEVELAATFELGAPTGRALAGLPGLRRLTVRGRAVATADGFWAELRTAPKLAHLTLRGGASTDALRAIAALPALEVLEIPGTALARVDLRALAAAKRLRRLDLSYAAGLTGATGPELAALTNVRELVIANTLSGDQTGRDNLVPFLGRLSGLKYLNIDQTGITAEGQRKLKERLPGCTVVYESVWDQWKNP
jgi:hypothetical protein